MYISMLQLVGSGLKKKFIKNIYKKKLFVLFFYLFFFTKPENIFSNDILNLLTIALKNF